MIIKKQQLNKKKIVEFIKRNPLLTLIIIAVVILFINILVALIFSGSKELTKEEKLESEKASGTNLKPSDFPEQSNFLRLLPEYNEYFGISNLPLDKEENLKVVVELYGTDSRSQFDAWIVKFTKLENINFIYIDSYESKQLGFSLARSKYSTLLEKLPYNSNLFTITARFDVEKGVKFNIFYDPQDTESTKSVVEFINKYNLFQESLTIEYMGSYLDGLDWN